MVGLHARLLALVILGALGSSTAARAEELLVAVQMNDRPVSDGEFVDVSGDHIVIPADLARRLRLKLPGAATGDRIDLAGITGIRSHLDVPSQTLRLEVDPTLLEETVIGGFLRNRPYDRANSVGLFGNYTVLIQGGAGRPLASSLLDLGMFAPSGTAATDISASNITGLIRLQSHLGTELDNGDKLQLGDGFLYPGSLGQSFPFAGISLTSRSASEGGIATIPVQSVLGQAALPSTVDVFVNDALQSHQSIDAGPFSIQNLPTVTGQGEVRVVVHDVLGREEVITRSFFGSTRLLAPDSDEYGYQAGILRRNYAISSFDYAEPFAAVTWQHGAASWLTTELHGEASNQRQMIGGQGNLALGGLGVVHLGAAASRFQETGALASVGFDGQVGKLSMGVSTELASRGFSQLGYPGDRTLREASQAHASLNLGTNGAIDISFLRFHLDEQRLSSTLAAGYSVSIANWLFIDFSLSQNLTGAHDLGGFLTFSFSFNDGATASASTTRSDRKWQTEIQANTATPALEGFAYSGAAQYGALDQTQASVLYRNALSDLSASVGTFGSSGVGRLTAAGAVELIDGRLFATRQENGAFALVETDEPGIHVAVDQQAQGVTDADGHVFIPHLRPGEINRVTIDPGDVPLDAALPPAEQTVVPHTATGYVIKFPVRHLRSGTLQLVDGVGKPWPGGTIVRLIRTGAETPVGLDGTVYLNDILDGDAIEVVSGGCTARLHLPGTAAAQYKLGRVTCGR